MEPDVNSAIRKGYLQQVRYLLELGSSPNCRDDERKTPLMNCALIEDELWGIGVARTLMEKGAAMNLTCRRGMNVLHYACIYGRKHLMEVLLGSADFDIIHPDRQGNTPLHYAAAMGHEHLVSILIDAMRKYHLGLDKVNNLGFTALMLASRGGHELCMTTLLSRGADITPRDYVDLRTAKDYEEDFREQERNQQPIRRHRNVFLSQSQHRRPFSAMSYISGSCQSTRAGSAHVRSRPESASLLERRRGDRGEKTKEEVVDEDYLTTAEKDRAAGRMIRCVSRSNLRNKPEQLLNVSPMECFVKETHYVLPRRTSSLSLCRGYQNTNATWKAEIRKMYKTFHFQFTNSYCKPAVHNEPEPFTIEEHGGLSPVPSEHDGGEKSKKPRKSSGKSSHSTDEKLDKKGRKASAKSISRKSSNVSMTSLKCLQALADSSSSESVNKTTRKRNPNDVADSHDTSNADEHSKSDKNLKSRPRKHSGAIEAHVGMLDLPTKSGSRGVSVPTVKEPIGQDQLGAIRE